jgi:tRNA-specific 2-thiouridylase
MSLKDKKTVFVGLSGGVDSSVAAALLKEATPNNYEKLFGRPTPKGFRGYDVVGVFIRVWQPDFIKCTWREERRDAMRVCAKLDIPFLTFDLEKTYKKEVADYMIREYKAGRTPNPDVMCNKNVKFGAFLKKALAMGADYVATGHYAQNKNNILIKGADPAKDQAYFLWTLKQEQLKHILFPVGHLKKNQVRKLAEKYGLHTFQKKDSQGICFLGKLDMKDFLKHYIKPKQGKVLNMEGKAIGIHSGATFLTLGERHGFTITKKTNHDHPYYVVAKDVKKNTITVSQHMLGYSSSDLSESQDLSDTSLIRANRRIDLENTNWTLKPDPKKIYQAQIRYHGEFLPCQIKIGKKDKAIIQFKQSQLVSPGQSIVIYDNKVCLGGGVVA